MTADVASVQDILTDIGILTVEHDYLVRGIDVEALTKRERGLVVIQGRVRGRIVDGDGRVGEAGNELLDVSNPLHASNGGAERRPVPEEKVHPAQY